MKNNIPKEYISRISKASTYFSFRNGPIKKFYEEGKLTDDEFKEIQKYMENHLAYLFNVLLEENDLKKFDLIISTMDKFYINDNENIQIEDDGFDNFYNNLFNINEVNNGINLKR
jgi:hypothetical protein